MLSKTLLRLIDQATLPAIILLCVRITSILLISYILNIDLTINRSGFVFQNIADYKVANTYSILAMVILLSTGLAYTLIKAFCFHSTHVTPYLTARLFSLRLATFIQSSFDIYSQGFIWLMYSYLLMFLTCIFALFGHVATWVFFVSLLTTIISTVLLIIDIENEMEIKINSDMYIEDESPTEEFNYA